MELKIVILATGVFIGLGVLGLQKTVLSLLAGAGIVGIAIGFAFQDLAENFIAGIVMGIRKPFQAGDLIETQGELGQRGKPQPPKLHSREFQRPTNHHPEQKSFPNKLINFSQTDSRRIEIEVGVAFDTDIERATNSGIESIKEKCGKWLLKDKEVKAFAL